MRRGIVCLAVWLGCAPLVLAGEVTLTVPDRLLRGLLDEVCGWYHVCGPEGTPDAERAHRAADRMIQVVSFGHFDGLESLRATLTLRYDREISETP